MISCTIYDIIVGDAGANLSVTGSNVGTAVKADQQAVTIEDGPTHPTERSRPPSKWCMYHIREEYYFYYYCCCCFFCLPRLVNLSTATPGGARVAR